MTTVVCVGIAVLDFVFTVDELPSTAGKHFAAGFREVGGGVAANAAVTVAALGGCARYLGRVGTDPIGNRILSDLEDLGVDTSRVRRVAGHSSPVSAVLVDARGARVIVNHTDPALFGDGAVDQSDVADADVVLADLRWPAGAASALRAATRKGVPGVLDYDLSPASGTGEVLAIASHVAFAQPALARLTGVDDPGEGLRRARDHTGAFLAVTAGDDGVYWLDGHTVRHLQAYRVATVDTLGAGDVFHGALALALGEGAVIEEALRRGTATAALKCTRPGGRAGIPTRAEVDKFLSEVD